MRGSSRSGTVRAATLRLVETRALKVLVLALAVVALLVLVPLWLPLVLAAWVARLARPVAQRVERVTGGRKQVAAGFTLLLILFVLVPIAAAVISLASGAADLVAAVSRSPEWSGALRALVTDGKGDAGPMVTPAGIAQLLKDHGATAWQLLAQAAGVATEVGIALFVFALAVYAFLVDGGRAWGWLRLVSPIKHEHLTRLTDAFYETGRGLIIGMGGTSLAQGIVGTIAYAALGVPRPFVLGFLTFVTAFIPSIGTALVWVPVAAGLALTGHYVQAGILFAVGAIVISSVDNLMRPMLSRWGKLRLPVVVQVVAMFGAFAMFGASGLILGPLAVRLAREALLIAREEGLTGERVHGA